MTSDVYFAADDTDKVIDRCQREIQTWGSTSTGSNVFTNIMMAYWRNVAAYYSTLIEPDSIDTALGFAGEKGELVRCLIPKARLLIRQYVALATRQRYQFEVTTDVNDATPVETARLGKSLINAEVEKNSVDMLGERITEACLVKGMCWVSDTWATDQGEIWGRATDNTVLYTGGTQIEVHDLHEVIFNWSHAEEKNLEWLIIRRRKNRWNLVAQFPELADEIKSLPSIRTERMNFPTFNLAVMNDDEDYIYVNEFYHKPTPALPFGRMLVYGNQNTVFFDGNNPYEKIPARLFRFQNIDNTLLGYPLLSSLLPAQEMLDHEVSVISSNHQAFGVQSVLVPKGSDISVQDTKTGLNFISYTPQNAEGGGEPKALQLTATPPEIFQMQQALSAMLDELSGINATLRGQPPANVTSGAMAATLAAQALEFITSDTKGLTLGIEALMQMSLDNYKLFAKVEQIIDVVGEGNTSAVEQFKAQRLNNLKRVKCRVGNPLMATVSGRLQLGEAILPMLQAGDNQAVSKYLGLIEGAPVESMFDSELSENTAIQQEIESLMKGETVTPYMTDNHPAYIREYRKILYNQNVRRQGQIVQHIMDLILERLKLEQLCPPELKAILRGLPMPQPAPQAQSGLPSEAVTQKTQETAETAMPAEPTAAA